MKPSRFIGLFAMLLMGGVANAQSDCSQSIISAERAYYTGRFNEVSELLAGCLTSGFDKQQRAEAYRLIALSNIFSRNFEQADSALHLMLKIYPQYEFSAQDPPEFKKRVEAFKPRPIAAISIGGGAYLPAFRVGQVHNLRNLPSDAKYESSTGYQVGLGASYFITKAIVVDAAFEFQSFAFKASNKDTRVETRLEETQKRQQVMLAGGYNYKLKGITIRLSAGVSYNTLKKATASVFRLENIGGDYISREEIGFSNLERRATHDLRPLILLKVSIPQKNNFGVDFFMRYEHGTKNFTANRYANVAQLIKYEWLEDDFKADYFTLGVNFTKLFYHVKQ